MASAKELMELCVTEGASDLHVTVGRPPTLRKHGRLVDLAGAAPMAAADTEAFVRAIAPERSWKEAQEVGSADFAVAHSEAARFRVNVFKQKGFWGAACRLIPSKLLSLEEIGLPDFVKELVTRPRGLLLVTGPTGSGKTTTLASLVHYVNQNFDRHVITIEDPVEYYHSHGKSVIMQRELHVDVPTFSEGMRRALRQDPNVILLGEMRDLETISAAITAAETGHLVLATLHTTGAARTVDRIIDAFPTEAQEQIRAQLSVSLIAVISQALLPRSDKKGRVAAFEIMVMTPAIENHIRKNETFKIPSVIQTSRRLGMVLLDDHLLELWKAGKIDRETALRAAQSPKDLEPKLA
ncbi:MAG: type IV pilus twitching motility protein PilT [Planctomycetes bacterium]|nr:type IV pilus twitching motility protein PilT [Planctomycetota bacterium]